MALVPLITSFLLAFAAGSKIEFEVNPTSIQDSLTQELVMRCDLNDTASLFAGGVVGKRDVTETASNVQHVTSIIIMRNSGEHVASVTNYDTAKPLADLNNLNVTGDLSGAVGERGFIELTWEFPTAAQSGEYVCEINAIDDAGHNVVFTSSLEVGVTQPSIDELVKMVDALKLEMGANVNQIKQLFNKLSNLASVVSNCGQPKHYETGALFCGDSNDWHSTGQGINEDRDKTVTINFKQPYDKPPLVKLGLDFLDHQNTQTTRLKLEVVRVTKTGFSVKCFTWAGSHMYNLGVNWMSFPR